MKRILSDEAQEKWNLGKIAAIETQKKQKQERINKYNLDPNKGKNRGKGRFSRLKRYKEGKSY